VRVIGGLQTALVIQLTVVALGLGALLLTSTLAFDAVKFLGAAYLIWIGIQKWRSPPEEIDAEKVAIAAKGLFMEGLLVNLTNPKAIVFIAALTPQFIDPSRPQWPQFVIMGLTMCGVDSIVMSGYALLATRLRRWLRNPAALKSQNRFFGGIFVGAGVLLANSSRT
jgi:homoserine/homoserine lactone efflux protein